MVALIAPSLSQFISSEPIKTYEASHSQGISFFQRSLLSLLIFSANHL